MLTIVQSIHFLLLFVNTREVDVLVHVLMNAFLIGQLW